MKMLLIGEKGGKKVDCYPGLSQPGILVNEDGPLSQYTDHHPLP